jgi:hypothetical protein
VSYEGIGGGFDENQEDVEFDINFTDPTQGPAFMQSRSDWAARQVKVKDTKELDEASRKVI